jgi:NADH-quinone oxidoreductase subunit C
MSEALKELAEIISAKLAQEITSTEIQNGELILNARRDVVCKVLTFLRDDATVNSNC